MAKRKAESGAQPARSGEDLTGPELSALLRLVRGLAREAAREAWSASLHKGPTCHEQDD